MIGKYKHRSTGRHKFEKASAKFRELLRKTKTSEVV